MRRAAIAAEAAGALLRHRLRSALSALGIVFAVAAVVAMLAVAEGARRVTLEQIGRLGARNVIVRSLPATGEQRAAARERRSRGLEEADADALAREVPTAAAVAPLRQVAATVGRVPPEERLEVLAVGAAHAEVAGLSMAAGRFLIAADLEQRSQVCVLGAAAARVAGAGVGGDLRVEDRLYRVVGVLREVRPAVGVAAAVAGRDHDRCVFVPLGAEPDPAPGAEAEPGALAEITLLVRPGASVEAAAAAVRGVLARRHGGVEDVQVVVPRELLRQAQRTQRVFNWVLGCIAGISLLVGGIGVMNVMLAGVAERTREVGLRRAVGATRRAVALQFLAEAVLLTAAGGAAGAALGAAGAALVTALAGWRTAVTAWALALALGTAIAVGLAAGLYPALRAARLDPIAALRHE